MAAAPAPITGEALSSWLRRIAKVLALEDDTLVHDLGYHLPDRYGIDLSPPPGFVDRLSQRTGVPTDQIRAMSLAGYCPWLMEDLQPISDGFTTYTRQMSVLFAVHTADVRPVRARSTPRPGRAGVAGVEPGGWATTSAGLPAMRARY